MQLNCWSLRCSWCIACRRCPNHIFIIGLTPGFNGLGKDNCKTWRETFKFWNLVHPISEIWRHIYAPPRTASDWFHGPLIPLSMGNCQWTCINTLRPRQNGRHFADDIFKCILLNENVLIPNKISLKFVPEGPINNIPALVQIMAWRRPGDKPLSEPMMVRSLTHICVNRPQWVNNVSLGKDIRQIATQLWCER